MYECTLSWRNPLVFEGNGITYLRYIGDLNMFDRFFDKTTTCFVCQIDVINAGQVRLNPKGKKFVLLSHVQPHLFRKNETTFVQSIHIGAEMKLCSYMDCWKYRKYCTNLRFPCPKLRLELRQRKLDYSFLNLIGAKHLAICSDQLVHYNLVWNRENLKVKNKLLVKWYAYK